MKLPIVNIRIETMLYAHAFESGEIGGVMAGGARVERVAQSLGITIPKPVDRGKVVRADVDYVYLGVNPDPKLCQLRFLCSVEESCPMDWMVRAIWGALAGRLMGMLATKVEARAAAKRSQSDERFSDAAARQRLAFYQDIEHRIAEKLAPENDEKGAKERCPSDASTAASDASSDSLDFGAQFHEATRL